MAFNKRRRNFIKSKGHCTWCKTTENLTLDHIIPLCLGGSNWQESNWQVLCLPCNSRIKSVADQKLYYLHLECYNPFRYRDEIKAKNLSEFSNEELLALQQYLTEQINNQKLHKNTKRKRSLEHITKQLINRGV
jgi:hypothetical protein